MEEKFCWRCNVKVKMLDDEEFELCRNASLYGKRIIDEELKKRKIHNHIWLHEIETRERYRYLLEMYRIITGEYEPNPLAIFHHKISEFGKDCPNCKKPFRTPKARYCPSCGYGKENVV
ncbi:MULTISPECIES: hypothetical protein [unclassified Flavobacterium]|uniref:hypothetical protein n=1 Tax=unclassified Flavobacterium TaxID=196869 RepID=UPI001F132054|nr:MULTISPECIES: hypothetical protein [unclassified Flavobacterium]UMY65137.1 hypothetical protein MKO97_11545 [Flavobacterium sp. HJ-32-4]